MGEALEHIDSNRREALELLSELEQTGVLTSTSLELPAKTTYEQWEAVVQVLLHVRGMMPWLIGDSWNFGEAKFGERAAQAANASIRPETLSTYAWVCRRIAPQQRHPNLSFSHHRLVAHLSPKERDRWLQRAFERDWRSRDFRSELMARRLVEGQRADPPAPAEEQPPAISPREALTQIKSDPTWGEVAKQALVVLDEEEATIDEVVCPKCGEHFHP